VSRRCGPLIAAAVAAVALAPAMAAAQTPATGTAGTTFGLVPGTGAAATQGLPTDPNAALLQPQLQSDPNKPPRFRHPGDAQTLPPDTFTTPSRIGAIPQYGSPQGFGAGDTGFDSKNLPKSRKKKLQAQIPLTPPGVEKPDTTFDPLPTTDVAPPPPPPSAPPPLPPPVIYPLKAANRPGATLPPLAVPAPVSNPPPEVYPLAAANRPGAKLPLPPVLDAQDAATAALLDTVVSASTPMPGTQPINTLPLGTPVQHPPPIAATDPYGPVGIRGGSLIFFPSVELSSGYDTNPAHIPGGPSSAYFMVAPELQAQSDWSRHSLTADIRGSYMDYTSDEFQPSLNRPYLNSLIDGRIDVTRDTQLLLENRVLVTTQNPGSPNLQAGLASLPIVTTVGGTFGIMETFNRLMVSLKGLLDRSEYQPSQLTNGQSSGNGDENFNQYAGIARVGYEINPELKPFVELEEDERIHDDQFDRNGQQRNSVGTSATVGATLALTDTLTGEMAVGYLERTYQDQNLPSISGMIANGALTWQATALTSAKFTTSSVVNESIIQNVSGSLSRDINVEVDHALRYWLVLNGIVGYGRDEYVGLGRDDSRYFVSGGVTYKISREVWLKGELRHDWLTSNVPNVAYDSTSVLLTLRLQR
jgi:hypothetical protein